MSLKNAGPLTRRCRIDQRNIQAAAARQVRGELFPTNPPTSTLLVVSQLASPDYLMEIEAIAVVDSPSS